MSQASLASPLQKTDSPEKSKEEKAQYSPNGFFQLKTEHREMFKGTYGYKLIFSAKSEDENGAVTWHELWNRITYTPDDALFVSDSGRVLEFFLANLPTIFHDPVTQVAHEGNSDLAAMYVWDTDGREMAGLDLLEPFGLVSLDEVRRMLLMGKTVVEAKNITTRTYQEMVLPFATDESYTLVFKDGSKKRYDVVFSKDMDTWVLQSDGSDPHPLGHRKKGPQIPSAP